MEPGKNEKTEDGKTRYLISDRMSVIIHRTHWPILEINNIKIKITEKESNELTSLLQADQTGHKLFDALGKGCRDES